MSTIAEFLWLVANDPDARKLFEAEFAPAMIKKHGRELSQEQREAFMSGDPEKINAILLIEQGGNVTMVDATWQFAPPPDGSGN